MFTPFSRKFLMMSCIALGLFQAYQENFFLGAIMLLAGLLVLYGHFRYGPIWLAFRYLKQGKIDEVKALIKNVRPEWLAGQHRAYFFLIKAEIAHHEGQLNEAQQYFLKTLESDLGSSHSRAAVCVSLAEVQMALGDVEGAIRSLEEGKSTHHRETLNPLIENVFQKVQILRRNQEL